MTEFRAIRIHMPDRPGALSAISAALAAHQVDIVRLDVVSHEGATVVDDLLLSAATQQDIGSAIGSFYPEVTVRTFEELSGDPTLEMGAGLGRIASSSSVDDALAASMEGVRRISRGDEALLLRATKSGGFTITASTVPAPAIAASDPFAGRWVLEHRAAAAFPVAEGWAPIAFQYALSAAWVAIAPAGAFDLVVAIRRLNIPFYSGELERFATFAEAAGQIIAGLGDRPSFGMLPAVSGAALPARAVTMAERLPMF